MNELNNTTNPKFGDWGLGIGDWGLGQSPIPIPIALSNNNLKNLYLLNLININTLI